MVAWSLAKDPAARPTAPELLELLLTADPATPPPVPGRVQSAPVPGRVQSAAVPGRAQSAIVPGRAQSAPVPGQVQSAPVNGRAQSATAPGWDSLLDAPAARLETMPVVSRVPPAAAARPRGNRRRMVAFGTGLTVLLTAAVAVAVNRADGDRENAAGSSPSAGATSPSTGAESTAPLRLAPADPLTSPGAFKETDVARSEGTKPGPEDEVVEHNCTFAAEGLVMGGDGDWCDGPGTRYRGDLTIKLDVAFQVPNTCVNINELDFGEVQFCDYGASMSTLDFEGMNTHSFDAVEVAVGRTHRTEIDIRKRAYVVRVGGTRRLAGSLEGWLGYVGKIRLGSACSSKNTSKRNVVVSKLEVWAR